MAKDGLSLLLCAAVLFGALTVALAGEDERIRTTLAVQTALRQGREHLLRREYAPAIRALHSQVNRIDGNREYLTVLRDAYRGRIKELRLDGRDSEAAVYTDLLAILERGPMTEGDNRPSTSPSRLPTAPAPARKSSAPAPSPVTPALAHANALPATAPGKNPRSDTSPVQKTRTAAGEPTDPFRLDNHRRIGEARALLARAEEAFRNEKYSRANELYAQAHEVVPDVTRDASGRWSYCRLHDVVQRLNGKDSSVSSADLTTLEKEVRTTTATTPQLKAFGDKVLAAIETRRASAVRPQPQIRGVSAEEVPTVKLSHSRVKGWSLAESANFRVFHNQDTTYAEMVIRVAEATRTAMQQKWFGRTGPTWKPRCDIYLYPDGEAYARATSQSPYLPGHSKINRVGSRITLREVHLRVDEPKLLKRTLPHETTHIVLAGCFGPFDLPRWADEGMAVLSEADRLTEHLRDLPRYREVGHLFSIRQLMSFQDNWPEHQRTSAFYAQSSSLIDFLCRQKGHQVFSQFIYDAMRGSYEESLRKHYGIQGYQELEDRWKAQAFASPSTSGEKGVARR
jgi:hypothetical protein